jgi:hypothetical protein
MQNPEDYSVHSSADNVQNEESKNFLLFEKLVVNFCLEKGYPVEGFIYDFLRENPGIVAGAMIKAILSVRNEQE